MGLSLLGLALSFVIPSAHSAFQILDSQMEVKKVGRLLRSLQIESQIKEKTIELQISNQTLVPSAAKHQPMTLTNWTLEVQSATPNLLSFFPSGVVSPATFLFSSRRKKCEITLSLYGNISIFC